MRCTITYWHQCYDLVLRLTFLKYAILSVPLSFLLLKLYAPSPLLFWSGYNGAQNFIRKQSMLNKCSSDSHWAVRWRSKEVCVSHGLLRTLWKWIAVQQPTLSVVPFLLAKTPTYPAKSWANTAHLENYVELTDSDGHLICFCYLSRKIRKTQ